MSESNGFESGGEMPSSSAAARPAKETAGKRACEGASDDLLSAWFHGLVGSDEAAFESLFRATYGRLVRYATRIIGDESNARDVVQEVFVRIWERRDEHDPTGSIQALLFRTARNLALNRVRNRERRKELLEERYDPPRRSPDGPEEHLRGRELERRLRDAIEALPPRQKEALELSRFQGLSHDEAAEVMGIAPRTVNNHLVRALRSLRESLEEEGPEPPPGR